MNGVPQSGADRSATAESRVRANWSNLFTVEWGQFLSQKKSSATQLGQAGLEAAFQIPMPRGQWFEPRHRQYFKPRRFSLQPQWIAVNQ